MSSDRTSDEHLLMDIPTDVAVEAGTPTDVSVEASPAHSDDVTPEAAVGEIRLRATASDAIMFYYDAASIQRRKSIYRFNRGRRSEAIESD